VGDWLRDKIEAELVVERDGWVGERVERVMARLQRDVPEADRLETLVIWTDEHTAFTALGRTIYFSRRLFERMRDDDAAAFVMAHEIAHHRLGHLPDMRSWWGLLPLRIAIARLRHTICGPEDEHEADLLAIELCMDAGYDVERCLDALDILAQVSLDYGDVDNVLGGETATRSSHPPLVHRIEAARAHADSVRRNKRFAGSNRRAIGTAG
jgi:Zn-dependent protease with chaperone function